LAGTSFKTTEPAETRTLANRYSGENQAADCNPASRAKKRPAGDANIRFNCYLCQAENPDIVAHPDMVADDQAPWKRDVHITADNYSFPNLRAERTE
jgi:hypothetical protein